MANLPKSDSTCDGNTIQGNTVLVAANGSASDPDYTIYLLPSPALGEQSNNQPVCNQTNPCVLYVGQNQNDFTAPKVFSTAFSIAPAAGASTPTTTTATASTSASTTSSTTSTVGTASSDSSNTTAPPSATAANSTSSTVAPGVTLSSTAATAASAGADATALASTGAPADLEWVIGFGIVLLLGGSLGRRLIGASRR